MTKLKPVAILAIATAIIILGSELGEQLSVPGIHAWLVAPCDVAPLGSITARQATPEDGAPHHATPPSARQAPRASWPTVNQPAQPVPDGVVPRVKRSEGGFKRGWVRTNQGSPVGTTRACLRTALFPGALPYKLAVSV